MSIAGTVIGAAIEVVTTLLDRGEKPTLDEVKKLAAAVARDEVMAIAMAQVLGELARKAESVRAAFDTKPGEVPVLDLGEVVVMCTRPGCNQPAGHESETPHGMVDQ